MEHEIVNTLISFVPPYQKKVSISKFNLFVIDNNSSDNISPKVIESISSNIKYIKYPYESVSPVHALNWAIDNYSNSDSIMICIDGARMVSDHILYQSFEVFKQIPNAFVFCPSYHIGKKYHQELSAEGYTIEEARVFLKNLQWQTNPDKLFKNAILAKSSRFGIYNCIAESNAIVTTKENYKRLRGYNTGFVSPGGGYSNLELFERYTLDEETINVSLIGEGSFHQFHNGISTSKKNLQLIMKQEYELIKGRKYSVPKYTQFFYGKPRNF